MTDTIKTPDSLPNVDAQIIEARATLTHLRAITRRADGTYPDDVRELARFLDSPAVVSQFNQG